MIAQAAEELYSARNAAMTQAALLRAQMMDYRDKRPDGMMQSLDWARIDDGLARSYQLLKIGITETPPNSSKL